MYAGVCVYIRTHTHTAQMGYSDVSPGVTVGMRHLGGLKNPDGLDLGLTAFFFNIFFLPKKKSKRCERKLPIISNLK